MNKFAWHIIFSMVIAISSCNKTSKTQSGSPQVKKEDTSNAPQTIRTDSLPKSARQEFQEELEAQIRKRSAMTTPTTCFYREDSDKYNYTEYFEAVGVTSEIVEDRLSEQDRLNGVEFSGKATLSCSSRRQGNINNDDGSFVWQPYKRGENFLMLEGKKTNGKWDMQIYGPSGGFFPEFVAEDSAKKMVEEKSSGTALGTFQFVKGYISGQRTKDVKFQSGEIAIHNKGIMARSSSNNSVFYVPFVRISSLTFQKISNGQRDIRIHFDYRDGSPFGFLDLEFSSNEISQKAASTIYSTYNTWKESATEINPPRFLSNELDAANFE